MAILSTLVTRYQFSLTARKYDIITNLIELVNRTTATSKFRSRSSVTTNSAHRTAGASAK